MLSPSAMTTFRTETPGAARDRTAAARSIGLHVPPLGAGNLLGLGRCAAFHCGLSIQITAPLEDARGGLEGQAARGKRRVGKTNAVARAPGRGRIRRQALGRRQLERERLPLLLDQIGHLPPGAVGQAQVPQVASRQHGSVEKQGGQAGMRRRHLSGVGERGRVDRGSPAVSAGATRLVALRAPSAARPTRPAPATPSRPTHARPRGHSAEPSAPAAPKRAVSPAPVALSK